MLEYDPVKNIVHWPGGSMARFGQNPFGENLYRIVSAPTVRHLVGGYWPNEDHTAYHWVRKYPAVNAGWILERWNWEQKTKHEWEKLVEPVSGWPIFGPYPSRGVYELAWEFDKGVDADNLDTIIGAIERGRYRSFEDIRQAHKAEYEAEERDQRRESEAEIRDCLMAFGTAPVSSSRIMRGSKTRPDLVMTAQQAGLPVPGRGIPKDLRGFDLTSSVSMRRM